MHVFNVTVTVTNLESVEVTVYFLQRLATRFKDRKRCRCRNKQIEREYFLVIAIAIATATVTITITLFLQWPLKRVGKRFKKEAIMATLYKFMTVTGTVTVTANTVSRVMV